MGHRRGVTTAVPTVGRAVDAARTSLRAAFGHRVRVAGPDRTEALAMDGSALLARETVLADDEVHIVDVDVPRAAHFEGFLDGIQRSSTLVYLDGVPVVHGTAAAAIRERDARGRMTTWRTPAIEHAVYVSRSGVGEAAWTLLHDALDNRGHVVHDTDDSLPVPSMHPSALLRQALDMLSRVRNESERAIGESWCAAHEARPLYIDGSLRRSRVMLGCEGAVGVIKSHATLYLPDDKLALLADLGAGQRTSVLTAIDANQRPVFLTWYLRLRSATGHDPFFGLIRVESGVRGASPQAAEAHASRVSSWLLAERAPLARPDARWDVMPYAIRDCEVYLRAVA